MTLPRGLALAAAALGLLLTACPEDGDTCAEGLTRCGDTCAPSCGGCEGPDCRWDAVVACFNTGHLTGLRAERQADGSVRDVLSAPAAGVTGNPQALAAVGDVLTVVDAISARLHTVHPGRLARLPSETLTVDAVPNHLLSDGENLWSVSSGPSTLLAFRRTAAPLAQPQDGTRYPDGLGLVRGGFVGFGANTNAWAAARLGTTLYVTLYGGMGRQHVAGGRVARVDVTDPQAPRLLEPAVELPAGAELEPFSADTPPIARPTGIAAHAGAVWVALNNLDETYAPAGPGMLARIDPATQAVTKVRLPPECLNAGWLRSAGDALLVTCSGRADYATTPVGVSSAAVVAVLGDGRTVVHPVACPAGAAGCAPFSPGRFEVLGRRVYVGDNASGRVLVLEWTGSGFTELAGPAGALAACPASESGLAYVADVVAVPQ